VISPFTFDAPIPAATGINSGLEFAYKLGFKNQNELDPKQTDFANALPEPATQSQRSILTRDDVLSRSHLVKTPVPFQQSILLSSENDM
jgi:hypothetical protein